MVVNVVVMERTEGDGDEKVLPSPPPTPFELIPPLRVAAVPVFEVRASEFTVSGFVDIVGAIDFAPMVGGAWPSLEAGRDDLLCVGEGKFTLWPDGGVLNER